MKILSTTFFVLLFLAGSVVAQTTSDDYLVIESDTFVHRDSGIYAHPVKGEFQAYGYVEKMPEPNYDLYKFMQKNIQQQYDGNKQLYGKVNVVFIVTDKGLIAAPRVAGQSDKVHPKLKQEALRVAKSFPPWKPGMQNGKPVHVFYLIPFTFR